MATVLVVDDEVELCLALKMYLERMGHRVVLFHSGKAARSFVSGGGIVPDYAFVDHQLGSESGAELVVYLMEVMPGLRVILMSGFPLDEDELPQFPDAKVEFLQKPFRSAEVADCLQRVG